MNVLIVDSDEMTSSLVKFLLEGEGFKVSVSSNTELAMRLLDLKPHQLVLIEMPLGAEGCGLNLCRKLREDEYDIPVIFVAERNSVADKLAGLRAGADDYIAKPFDPVELVERVKAVLRRYSHQLRNNPIAAGRLTLNMREFKVTTPQRREVALTPTEMRVLRYLLLSIGRTVSRKSMINSIWGYDYEGESNQLDVYIRRLRMKIEKEPSQPELILTVRGVGYKLLA